MFTLTSPDHKDGAKFDGKFTCDGGALGAGIIPELDWANPPAGTMFYAITFIDTTIGADNAMGQHWAAWDIPVKATKFPQGATTLTGDLMGGFQNSKFLAPCAVSLKNSMDDQYEFTIFALKEKLGLADKSSVAKALDALKKVTPLGSAKLTGHSGLKGK
jgi:phosphatidylethanolamine-binding protein (PEBP) family uncharacterized protein